MPSLNNIKEIKANNKKFFYAKINNTKYGVPLPTINFIPGEFTTDGATLTVDENSKLELRKMKGLDANYPDAYSNWGNSIKFYSWTDEGNQWRQKIAYSNSNFINPLIQFEMFSSEALERAKDNMTAKNGALIQEIQAKLEDSDGYRGNAQYSKRYDIILYNSHLKNTADYSVPVNDVGKLFGLCYGSLPNPRSGEQYPDMETITLNGERVFLADDGIFHIGPYEFHGMQNGDFRVNSDFYYTKIEEREE